MWVLYVKTAFGGIEGAFGGKGGKICCLTVSDLEGGARVLGMHRDRWSCQSMGENSGHDMVFPLHREVLSGTGAAPDLWCSLVTTVEVFRQPR